MVRVAQREELTPVQEADKASREYLLAKAEADRAAARVKVLRDVMFEKLEAVGETDDLGHVKFSLPQSVNGISALVKQRRVSRKINEPKAREIADDLGLGNYLFKTVEVIDEDAIMQALVEGLLSEGDVDQMYPATVTYALITEKVK